MSEQKPIETRIASVVRDEYGILIVTMKDCGKVDEFDVIDLNLVLRHLSEGKPALKLFDANARWYLDKKARARARAQDSALTTKARAIVVSNKIKLTLFTFLESFGEKEYPQAFFKDRQEALVWLKSFIE